MIRETLLFECSSKELMVQYCTPKSLATEILKSDEELEVMEFEPMQMSGSPGLNLKAVASKVTS